MLNATTLRQLLRFVFVGGINTLVGVAAILGFRFIAGASDVVANLLGYLIGIVVSYVLNRRITFADRGAVASSLPRFLVAVATAYGANLITLVICLRVIGAASLVAQIASIAVYSVVFFLLAKLFAFRGAAEGTASVSPRR